MPDMENKPSLVGGKLIWSLYQIIHTARIHQDTNQLVIDFVSQTKAILSDLSREGNVSLQIWRGRIYVNGERLLYQRDNVTFINDMVDYFTQRQLGRLAFFDFSRKVSHEDFMFFVHLLDDSLKHKDPPEWMMNELRENGILWVEISRKLEEKPADLATSLKGKALNAYLHALDTVKEVAEKASKGFAGIKKARRLAQTIVDLIQEDSMIMLGLATIREYDDYTYTHSVNVAMLATSLGKQLGLSPLSLEHLTLSGLFHDLGKVGIPKEVLFKNSNLSDEERDVMRRHPLIGVKQIIRLNAPNALRSRIILGPFEHHLNRDLSGYPRTQFVKGNSLPGKILRIVDFYEALTSERVYRPRAYTPNEALRKMWTMSGKEFDPVLLKCFIGMMGIYPVGSIVEMENGEVGIVTEYPDESRKDEPLVMLLAADGSGGYVRRDEVILAGLYSQGNAPGRNIVKEIPPFGLGIQPAQFLMQEVYSA